MKANEYKAWYRRNDPGISRRGQSEYDRPFKERYERPPEYSPSATEINRYPMTKDIDEQRAEKLKEWESSSENRSGRKEQEERKRSRARNTARNATRGVVQGIVAPAVGVVAGAVILVSGYQAIVNESISDPVPIVQIVEDAGWIWSEEDMMSATVRLLDGDGNLIEELPATVTSVTTDATCTAEGVTVYTATATDEDGHEYTDSRSETIAPTGHSFGEGHLTESDGQLTIEYECAHCHEKFTVTTSVEEE